MRRVVITGLGLVTPLGADVETAWANILAGKSGAARITRFDPTDHACTIACEVKPADHEYGFDPNKRVDHKIQRQVDPFIVYGIDAAGQAIEDAGLTEMSEAERLRTGCSIGSGNGGLPGIEIEVVRSSGGVFDIEVDGVLKYSKRATGRFPTDAEIDAVAQR